MNFQRKLGPIASPGTGMWDLNSQEVYERLGSWPTVSTPANPSFFGGANDNLTTNHGTNFSSFTITWPSSITSSMVAVLVVTRDYTTGTTATPTGFTSLLNYQHATGGTSVEMDVFYRECNGTESGNITIGNSAFYGPSAALAVFDMGTTDATIAFSGNYAAGTGDADPPLTNPTQGDGYINLAIASYDDGPQYSITSLTPPSGYTTAAQGGTLANNGTSSSFSHISYLLSGTDAPNPGAFTNNGTSYPSTQDVIGATVTITYTNG